MYDLAAMGAWLEFGVRWLHVITAIAWIGSSFYFIALDLGLYRDRKLPSGADGEEWQVHGGGFYHIQKYLVAPDNMPEHLIWHKWQSYTTWLSGAALLMIISEGSAKISASLGADCFERSFPTPCSADWPSYSLHSFASHHAPTRCSPRLLLSSSGDYYFRLRSNFTAGSRSRIDLSYAGILIGATKSKMLTQTFLSQVLALGRSWRTRSAYRFVGIAN